MWQHRPRLPTSYFKDVLLTLFSPSFPSTLIRVEFFGFKAPENSHNIKYLSFEKKQTKKPGNNQTTSSDCGTNIAKF